MAEKHRQAAAQSRKDREKLREVEDALVLAQQQHRDLQNELEDARNELASVRRKLASVEAGPKATVQPPLVRKKKEGDKMET
eukprot:jgi/Pico_ML_1/53634/g416.t1